MMNLYQRLSLLVIFSCTLAIVGCGKTTDSANRPTAGPKVAPGLVPPNGFFIGQEQIENMDRMFTDGMKREREGEKFQFRVVDAGDMHLPSGKLVAADLHAGPVDAVEFDRTVAPGIYSTKIALVEFESQVQVGGLKIVFDDQPVEKWELATVIGNDVSNLEPGQFVGFTSQSGIAYLADLETVSQSCRELQKDSSELSKKILQAIKDAKGQYANFTFEESNLATKNAGEPLRKKNALVSSTGWGEGTYASYFGLSKDNQPVCLVVDFNVANEYEE